MNWLLEFEEYPLINIIFPWRPESRRMSRSFKRIVVTKSPIIYHWHSKLMLLLLRDARVDINNSRRAVLSALASAQLRHEFEAV